MDNAVVHPAQVEIRLPESEVGILDFLTAKKVPRNEQVSVGLKDVTAPASVTGIQAKTMDVNSYLASDEKAWINYLHQTLRAYRKPGLSVREEYELWFSARSQGRAAETGRGVQPS